MDAMRHPSWLPHPRILRILNPQGYSTVISIQNRKVARCLCPRGLISFTDCCLFSMVAWANDEPVCPPYALSHVIDRVKWTLN